MRHDAKFITILLGLVVSVCLLTINTVGLFKDIRPENINSTHLRFNNESQLAEKDALNLLIMKHDEDKTSYSHRVNSVVSQSLLHIHWKKYDNQKFNQLIPVWENYFLYLMGTFSGIPEFERYHFSDYQRSIERGIGICGDASMILSQVLDNNNIYNKIITFPGHVLTMATIDDNTITLDPDFGIVIPASPDEIKISPSLVKPYYKEAGYSEREINNLVKKYAGSYEVWHGVEHFITKKYYFEKVAYALKWPLPILLFILCTLYFHRRRND